MQTNSHNRTPNQKQGRGKQGRGKRILLQLLAVALVATSCTIAIPLFANAAQQHLAAQDVTVPTTQVEAAAPITQSTPQNETPSAVEIATLQTTTLQTTTATTVTASAQQAEVAQTATTVAARAQLKPDAIGFIAATALPSQPEFAHLFGEDVRGLFAASPTYVEPVVVAAGQLKVDRIIDYELNPGVCKNATNRQTLGDLCFAVDTTADITPEIAAHVAEVRSLLANVNPTDEIVPGVTAADAQRLNDIDLLELSLNSGPRTITRSSAMPLTADGSLIALDPEDPVVASTFRSFDTQQFEAPTDGVFTDDFGTVAPFDFDTEYFLTGHTVYRTYSDEWSYEKTAVWHPRIFVSFSYTFNAGFGVRAPFSIDVDYVSGNSDETIVAVSVDPVSLDVAAGKVGLPADAYFDGKEFVLELNFDCELTASIAGLGGSVDCDDIYSIDTNFSQDFNPVIGDEIRNIHDWFLWEDGESPLRRELANGAIYGEVNLGIGADIVDGRVGVQIDAGSNTDISGVADGDTTWFDNRAAQYVTINRNSVIGSSSFEVSNPEYAFDVAVRPKVKFTAGVDTTVYENSWSFTAPLDFLGFSVGFGLDHHDDTVESHDYELYSGLFAEHAIFVETAGVFAP